MFIGLRPRHTEGWKRWSVLWLKASGLPSFDEVAPHGYEPRAVNSTLSAEPQALGPPFPAFCASLHRSVLGGSHQPGGTCCQIWSGESGGGIAEWEGEDVFQSERLLLVDLVDAEFCFFGRALVGSKEPIPPRHDDAEVAIVFARFRRVVHAVQSRGDQDGCEQAVNLSGKTIIAVLEAADWQRDYREQHHGKTRDATENDNRDLQDYRYQHFDGMEAKFGAPVQRGIAMVHRVSWPQHDPMPQVGRGIKQQQAGNHFGCLRETR
jgi:hypothetical protein